MPDTPPMWTGEVPGGTYAVCRVVCSAAMPTAWNGALSEGRFLVQNALINLFCVPSYV